MKRQLLILVLLIGSSALVQGQGYFKKQWKNQNTATLSVAAASFRSIRGWQQGVEVGFYSRKNVSYSIFSYSGRPSSDQPVRKYKGVQLGFPLLSLGKWVIGSNNRIGLHDERFVSFLPTVKLDYEASQFITASAGAGVSDRYPVFDFKLIFHLKRYIK